MSVTTSAGSTLGITASLPATNDVAGYSALSFTLVGEITDLGEFGREYNLITHNPIGSRGTQKYKGSYNEGSINLSLALDTDDAGQILAKAASLSDANYSFELTLPNGDAYYWQAKVMSWKVAVGGVDDVTTATCQLEITTDSSGNGVIENLA